MPNAEMAATRPSLELARNNSTVCNKIVPAHDGVGLSNGTLLLHCDVRPNFFFDWPLAIGVSVCCYAHMQAALRLSMEAVG